jgi:hypothetical protein
MAGTVPNDLPRSVRIAGRAYVPGAVAVAVLLTAAGWVLQRLPGQVVENQRGELIGTLGAARNLVVEVQCSPTAVVRVRDGQRLLIEMPVIGRQDGTPRASPGRDVGTRAAARHAATSLETAQARAVVTG